MKHFIPILAFAAAVIGAASCSSTAQTVDAEEALLALLPADTTGVIFVDVEALRGVEGFEEFLEGQGGIQSPQTIEDFSSETGLDLRGDLRQVLLGWDAASELLAVARADYDMDRVRGRLGERGVAAESGGGRLFYRPNPEVDRTVLFTEGLVLWGGEQSVREAAARVGNRRAPVFDDSRLLDAIRSIEAGYQIWGAGAFAARSAPELFAFPMMTDLISALERGTYQMRLDSGVTARAVGEFETPETAQRTTDLLRGLVALGRMHMMDQRPLVELLDGIRIDTVASAVEIRIFADENLLRRISDSDFFRR